jgi:hypothetical protein
MGTAQAVQALGHPWLLLLFPALWLTWILLSWVRTRINIKRFRAWDHEARDIGVAEDERHKLFAKTARRDLRHRDEQPGSPPSTPHAPT